MAQYNQDWDDLGRNIQDIVDRAVNSQDYQKLNQTIRQVVDRAVDLGSEAVRKAMDGSAYANSGYRNTAESQRKDISLLYRSTNGKTVTSLLKIVGGAPLSLFALFSLIGAVVLDAGAMGVLSLFLLAGGGWLTYSGVTTLGMVKRFKVYKRTLGQKTCFALEKLARSVGKSVGFVRRELRKMIHEGLFLEGHLDHEEKYLITSHETYANFEQKRRLRPRRHPLSGIPRCRRCWTGETHSLPRSANATMISPARRSPPRSPAWK